MDLISRLVSLEQYFERGDDPQTGSTGVRYIEPVPLTMRPEQREFAF